MDRDGYAREMTRRGLLVSLGPGMYVLGMAVANGAPLKKVPTATGIDAPVSYTHLTLPTNREV